MRIVNERLLASFRVEGPCESCGKWCDRREAAHIIARGMGSGSRLDVRINLVSLGPYPHCLCHTMHHKGRAPTRADLIRIVAAREGSIPDAVEAELRRLQNAPKGPGKVRRQSVDDKREDAARLVAGGVRARKKRANVDAHQGEWCDL